jgi:hypothetical protein
MMKLQFLWLAGAVLAASFQPLPAFAANKTVRVVAATPVSASELKAIYGDKTWLWKTGAGRFDTRDDQFSAFTREPGKESIGVGRWDVDDNGKLCIRATWYAASGDGGAATCFGHVKIGATIYQRRYPDGHWYVFRHAPQRAGDEARKLVSNNTVAPKIRQWKAATSKS